MKNHIHHLTILLLSAGLLAACGTGHDPSSVRLNDHTDSLSYIIGAEYAAMLKTSGLEVSNDAFIKGYYMAMNETDEFPDSIKLVFIDEINREGQAKQQEQLSALLQQNKEEGARFLALNLEQEGVKQLPNGLQYKILKNGSGPKPTAQDSIQIHYRAMFLNGQAFDESYQRGPQNIKLSRVIAGLSQGLQMMNTGSIYELYIPSNLAYGDEGITNVIPGGATLIYNVELIKIY